MDFWKFSWRSSLASLALASSLAANGIWPLFVGQKGQRAYYPIVVEESESLNSLTTTIYSPRILLIPHGVGWGNSSPYYFFFYQLTRYIFEQPLVGNKKNNAFFHFWNVVQSWGIQSWYLILDLFVFLILGMTVYTPLSDIWFAVCCFHSPFIFKL